MTWECENCGVPLSAHTADAIGQITYGVQACLCAACEAERYARGVPETEPGVPYENRSFSDFNFVDVPSRVHFYVTSGGIGVRHEELRVFERMSPDEMEELGRLILRTVARYREGEGRPWNDPLDHRFWRG